MTDLERRIGYRFRSPHYLDEALRHASLLGGGGDEKSYQRLEYLGDSVLNLCIAEEMYRRFPGASEGELSKARASVINNRNLVRVAERAGVGDSLRTDPSLRDKGGGVTRKMLADVVEAIVGAIFLDGGYEEAKRFVMAQFWEEEAAEALSGDFDAKSRLQERCQKARVPLPRYRLLSASGPPHAQTFHVCVRLADGSEAEGFGMTKKEAEMEAAARLLSRLGAEEEAG